MPSLDGAAGLVSAVVNSHYGTGRAAQIEYAPLGVPNRTVVGGRDAA